VKAALAPAYLGTIPVINTLIASVTAYPCHKGTEDTEPRDDKVPKGNKESRNQGIKETQILEILISTGATLPVCDWKAGLTPNQDVVPRFEGGVETKIPTQFGALQARNKWQVVRLIYV